NTGSGDQFGESMALSGDGLTLAVGAPFEASSASGINGNQADNTANAAGAVYVYANTGGTWAQQAYVKASTTRVFEHFGLAVALSGDGNTLAVGAPFESSCGRGIDATGAASGCGDSGAVYIFERAGTTWTQSAFVKPSNNDTQPASGMGEAFG